MTQQSFVRTFEDLVEAVKAIARLFETDKVFIIGSQRILLSWPDAPIILRTSGEIDAYFENGRPFTSNDFGNKFRDWCDQAGLPHCMAHELRKAGACIAAENGAAQKQLMAIFGWQTMKEAAHYTKMANQKKLAASAMPLLSIGQIEDSGSISEEKTRSIKDGWPGWCQGTGSPAETRCDRVSSWSGHWK